MKPCELLNLLAWVHSRFESLPVDGTLPGTSFSLTSWFLHRLLCWSYIKNQRNLCVKHCIPVFPQAE